MPRQSLVTRLLLWFGLAGAGTFLVLGSLALWNDYSRLRAAAQAQAAASVQAALKPLALAVWNLEEDQQQLYLRPLVQSGSIVRAELRDTAGKPIAAAARAMQPPPSPDSVQTVPLIVPGRERHIGDLVLTHSLAPMRAELAAIALHSLAFELLKLLIIGAGIYYTLNRLVLRRLRSLAAQVEALPPQDQATRLHDAAPAGDAARRDEIGTLVAACNQLLDNRRTLAEADDRRRRAEAESRAKSQFVSRMSHELRTPLNAILGFAQAMDVDGAFADEHYRRNLKRIIRSGWHLASLIGDVLDLERTGAGSVRLAIGNVDLEQCWVECLDIVEQDAAAAGVRLSFSAGADARFVLADPIRLRQVLVNLLSNGIKYNRRGGQVALQAQRAPDGAAVALQVADDGIGMSAQQLSALYEPFNRLGREASSTPGTGIGLIITKGLVELMQGTLAVQSEEGAGTTVTLRLPCGEPAAAHGALAAERLRAHAGPVQLLYVEDDPVNVEIMRALLAQVPEIQLVAARTVRDGLQQLHQGWRPAAVLVDMQLPDGSGLDFIHALRALPGAARLPVAIVSADSQGEAVSQALREGASMFIPKPLEFRATIAQILALLAAHAAHAADSAPATHPGQAGNGTP